MPSSLEKMHISVRKHLVCSPLEEEFRSLLCSPLMDGNSPSKQAPQSDMKMQWWDLLCPHKSSEVTAPSSLVPSTMRVQMASRLQSFKHQFFLSKGTFNNNISRDIFQYNVQHRSCSLYLSPLLHLPVTPDYIVYAVGSRRTLPLVLHSGTIVFHWKWWFPTITLLSSNERPSCQHRMLYISAPRTKVRAAGGRAESGTAITSRGHGRRQSNPLCVLTSAPCRKQSRAEQDACAAQVSCPKFTCIHTWTVGSTCLDSRDVRSAWVQSGCHWLFFDESLKSRWWVQIIPPATQDQWEWTLLYLQVLSVHLFPSRKS